MRRPTRTSDERGFAMLLVFAMAAAIAIALYMQVPRVAFESQRVKEQTLVDRGEAYQRAIQLFVRKNKRWPPDLDALEKATTGRFLRQRYRDPMTGKDEWRIIHVNGGILTDSILQKQKQKGTQESQSNFITSQNFVNTAPQPGADGNARTWDRRRPGEQQGNGTAQPSLGGVPYPTSNGSPVSNADPNNPQTSANTANQSQPQPNMLGQIGQSPAQQPIIPGQPVPVTVLPGQQPTVPATGAAPVQPIIPGMPFGGRGAATSGAQASSSQGSGSSFIGGGSFIGSSGTGTTQATVRNQSANIPGQPTTAGFGGTSTQSGTANNAAMDAIRNQLLNPGAAAGVVGAGMIPGSGIAGVASKLESEGIMLRDDHSKYNEWEFVYDPTKEKIPGQQQAGAVPNAQGHNSTSGTNSTGLGTGAGGTSFGGLSSGSSTTSTSSGGSSSSFIGGSTPTPATNPAPPTTTPKRP